MQTPKARANTSGESPRISPQFISPDLSEKSSPPAASAEVSKKHSPRVVRQLKTSPRYSDPTASSLNLATRPPKERSPRVSDRKSPRSPLPERKRPSRVAELESQISELENDLKNVRDQLCSSETSKKQAQEDAEESNQQLIVLSSKLEESEKQIFEQSASKKFDVVELSENSEERDSTLQYELEALKNQHLQDSSALSSAFDEIKQLKAHLEILAESEADQIKYSDYARIELTKQKDELAETLVFVEDMKNQLSDCKKSEAQAQQIVGETLMQLETAQKKVEALRSDGCIATEAYDAVASELEQSTTRINFLEELVRKLNTEICSAGGKDPHNKDDRLEVEEKKAGESVEMDFTNVKLEVEQLRASLAVAEIRHNGEQARTAEQMKNVLEMVEQIKSVSGDREAELGKSRGELEELKTNLMDKETELRGICEENNTFTMQLENTVPVQREQELQKLKADIENLRTRLKDKETKCRNISEENGTLKLETKEISKANNMSDEVLAALEAARAAEREALMKVGYMTEVVDKTNRKAARVTEQLEAAQAANAEMEAELRKLKVQSDQWRKAAEVAASMLSVGNNGQLVERTGSMDNNYSPRTRRMTSPYADNLDEDLRKKKNVNMLRRFGVLWKKPQK